MDLGLKEIKKTDWMTNHTRKCCDYVTYDAHSHYMYIKCNKYKDSVCKQAVQKPKEG